VHLGSIMAEIEPYSFEPMRDSSESEEDDVRESKMSAEEEIHRSVYASVVRTGKCNKEAVNKIQFQMNNTFVFSRC